MTQITDPSLLKKDLATALNLHIELLKDVEAIEPDSLDALLFTMRSLGFMLEKAPDVLIREDKDEELLFMMFQYYNLVEELKHNLMMNFPYAVLNGEKLIDLIQQFPATYQSEVNHWWENQTGLAVKGTKQTIIMD